jgi:phage terminase large subunit-like protein
MARRFYLNQIVAPEDAYLSGAEWAACATGDRLSDGDQIAVFFDGSTTDDHTALVACRMSDGLLEPLGHWVPEPDVNRTEVDAAVAAMFARFDVVAFYADVFGWESYIDRWRDDFGDGLLVPATSATGKRAHAIGWDMRGRVAEFSAAVARFEADTRSVALIHTGHPGLAQHIANAKRSGNRWGYSIRKEHRESTRKIDLAICAIGARMARRDVQNAGKTREASKPDAFVYFN